MAIRIWEATGLSLLRELILRFAVWVNLLSVDNDVRITLRLAAAQECVALVGFSGMSIGVFDFPGNDGLLASRAVAHSATIVQVDIVGFRQFKNALFVAGPFAFDSRFFKVDFWHVE